MLMFPLLFSFFVFVILAFLSLVGLITFGTFSCKIVVSNCFVRCFCCFCSFCLVDFLRSWRCRTRAGYSRGDQFYASYPAGTELLTDTTKVCEHFICKGLVLWF